MLSLFGGFAMAVIGFAILNSMRSAAWDDARYDSMIVVNILSDGIRQNFNETMATLKGVKTVLETEHSASDKNLHTFLFSGANANSVANDVRVVDYMGNLQYGSTSNAASLGDQLAVIAHANRSGSDLHVSGPLSDNHGGFEIVASIPYFASGTFAGVITARIPVSTIERMFESVQLSPGDVLGLTYREEILVARSSDGTQKSGRRIGSTAIALAMRSSASGHIELTGTIDGVQRLYTHSKVMGLPLRVYIGKSSENLRVQFWSKAGWIGVVIGLLAIIQTVVSAGLIRQERARLELENQLRHMATTDSLTNVANRRRFDEVLTTEWRRATRSGIPVALIMIDADYFKKYNDHYGHAAGDVLLRKIAEVVQRAAKRTSDLAARFGGEEFAVILPETSLADASAVGERLRADIQSLAVEHIEHPLGCVTVSAGVAALVPEGHQSDPLDLVMLADAALYEAKATGRNRVAIARLDAADAAEPVTQLKAA